jgi:ElaB/YqjD/DUF883 family membrane-anchored ribosome-binding protein
VSDDKPTDETTPTADKADAPPPAWRQQLESSLGDLQGLGNEIKTRLGKAGHTAQGEAKEVWRKLEPQIGAAEKTLVDATDEAVEQLQGLFGRLQGKLADLRDKLG